MYLTSTTNGRIILAMIIVMILNIIIGFTISSADGVAMNVGLGIISAILTGF